MKRELMWGAGNRAVTRSGSGLACPSTVASGARRSGRCCRTSPGTVSFWRDSSSSIPGTRSRHRAHTCPTRRASGAHLRANSASLACRGDECRRPLAPPQHTPPVSGPRRASGAKRGWRVGGVSRPDPPGLAREAFTARLEELVESAVGRIADVRGRDSPPPEGEGTIASIVFTCIFGGQRPRRRRFPLPSRPMAGVIRPPGRCPPTPPRPIARLPHGIVAQTHQVIAEPSRFVLKGVRLDLSHVVTVPAASLTEFDPTTGAFNAKTYGAYFPKTARPAATTVGT